MTPTLTDRALKLLSAALWVLLVAYAMLVVRDFYRFADRSVYLALDDGLANQGYAIATEGRYGFIASPTLFGIPRHFGEVSYGPWYFYLAGLLIWLFGYSLTLVRSIHLWIIVASVVTAALWFPRPRRAIAAAAMGLSILYCFNVAMWPMARPDSMVSAFAVMLIVCAGLGMTRDKARYWFLAGLAASCGTFTHLIAYALVPSCLLLFTVWAVQVLAPAPADRVARRRVLAAFAAVAAGGLLGAVMFYASFGFRFADQQLLFAAYDALIHKNDGYWAILFKHFTTAFDYLLPYQQWMVQGMLGLAWFTVAISSMLQPAQRRLVLAYVLPPAMVWSLYLLSSGFYTNHHKSYGILQEVSAAWTAGALFWAWLQIVEWRSVPAAKLLTAAVSVVILLQGGKIVRWHLDQGPSREEHARGWVSISAITDRVLDSIPAGATAWGPVVYGIEAPRRIQLIQLAEGLTLMPRVPEAGRLALAPDYIIWGLAEARDNILIVLTAGESLIGHIADMFPAAHYQLVSIVSATPYGANRIYARTSAERAVDSRLPEISMFDPITNRWLSRVGPAMPVAFAPVAPAEFRIGFTNDPAPLMSDRTVATSLPAGRYAVRVRIRPGTGHTRRRMVAVTTPSQLKQTIGELGMEGDFTGYWPEQRSVVLLANHAGGDLLVSLFDKGADPAIEQVEVFPVLGLLDDDGPLVSEGRPLPPVAGWQLLPGTRVSEAAPGKLSVEGNDVANGYQALSPAVEAAPGGSVLVDLDLSAPQGGVCTGILNGTQGGWLVPPYSLRTTFNFRMDRTKQFYVVVANCADAPGTGTRGRFTLGQGRYHAEAASFYTDRFMRAVFGDNLDGPR